MNLSHPQLAEFRHRVRSELNQILGYAELLSVDEADAIPQASIDVLTELQNCTRRILHTSQLLFNGEILDEATLRAGARQAMGATLREMERQIAILLNQLPPATLADLQRIQSAFIGLRASLDQPVVEVQRLSRGLGSSINIAERYSATVPPELRIVGRLLVIDDSEANRQLIDRQLVDLGLEVSMADSGPAALDLLSRHQFDCVLLDMILPEMDGPSILKSIRENTEWSSIPVVMLSALDELSEAARCIEIGAADYIIRPTERTFLRAKLHSTIQQKYLYEDCQKLGRDLEARNEELNRFVMVASHDLQAPLRTLETNLKCIERTLVEGPVEPALALAGDCLDRCQRMCSIVQDLLTYARLGQVEPFIETVELDWVLSEALANLKESIDSAGANIHSTPLPRVTADFKQMLYLFQNLLSNAIKYGNHPAPQVLIAYEERPESWLITITDNGAGIPEDQWQKIFEPFHRLHGDAIPGSGLGLAICKRAVEHADGRIWVNSVPGRGSTFMFTLPKP